MFSLTFFLRFIYRFNFFEYIIVKKEAPVNPMVANEE